MIMSGSVNIYRWGIIFFLAVAIPAGRAADEATTSSEGKGYLPWEKGSVKAGGFISTFDSTLAFGINQSADINFNAENLFGLDSSLAVFRAEAMYRPGESLRHQIDFSYASYHRDGRATLSQDITVNGVTYPVGATVDSLFNFDI